MLNCNKIGKNYKNYVNQVQDHLKKEVLAKIKDLFLIYNQVDNYKGEHLNRIWYIKWLNAVLKILKIRIQNNN